MLDMKLRIKSVLITLLITSIILGTLLFFRFEQNISSYLIVALYISLFLIVGLLIGFVIDWLTEKFNLNKFLNYLIYMLFAAVGALLFYESYVDMLIIFVFCTNVLWITQQWVLKQQNKSEIN